MYDICRIFAPRNIWSMKKELDAFSLDFAVELPDYPKMNTFPSRKGKSCYYAVYVPLGRVFQGVDCHSLSKNKGYYRYTSNTTVSSFFESFGIQPHK